MAKLLFYDDTHRYTVDGEEVPSVSELTRFISRELYADSPQFAIDGAALRGTKVHKATEALDKFGSVECEDDIAPYLKSYVSFCKDHSPDWEKIEWPVCNDRLYAGTIDRYGTIDGKKVLMDIKSTKNISPLHRTYYTAQLSLYKMAAVKEVVVDELWVVQLKDDETYKVYTLDYNEELAKACITLHEATKRKRRKRKLD